MPADSRRGLVSTAWLAERLNDPQIRTVDASWTAPWSGEDAAARYGDAHLPGAQFFDIDAVASRRGELPHMLPSAEQFAEAASRLGLASDRLVVVYDQEGISAAACRLWWTLRVFGHERVAVLAGGLPRWRAEGRPLTDRIAPAPIGAFTARYRPELVRDLEAVLAGLDAPDAQLVDARSEERFRGSGEEPWGEPGRIPGSRHLFYGDLLTPDGGDLVDEAAIRARFAASGVDIARPLAASCGSGVTACVLALALYTFGIDTAAVYDGSWAEWVRHPATPRVRG
jgi:thiosulfate/3-mercaptopyruvate sulfurtransferase